MDAVSQIGYQVNVQARNLATGNSRQILLIHASDLDAEPNSYYFSGLELGALTCCAQHGYQFTIQTVDYRGDSWQTRIMALVEEGRCDGLILPPPFSDEPNLVNAVRAIGCPVICISAGAAVREIVASVGIDDEAAGYDLAFHLVELGHRRFGYIKGLEGHMSAESRYSGFQRALLDGGIDPGEASCLRGNFTFHSGIECGEQLLTVAPDTTAIVCANDDMAAGVLLVCHKHAIAVPDRMSVVGFDDTPMSAIVWPPLTTVHQPIKEIARRAAGLLVSAIEAGSAIRNERQVDYVEHHIVVRQSAAPPP